MGLARGSQDAVALLDHLKRVPVTERATDGEQIEGALRPVPLARLRSLGLVGSEVYPSQGFTDLLERGFVERVGDAVALTAADHAVTMIVEEQAPRNGHVRQGRVVRGR